MSRLLPNHAQSFPASHGGETADFLSSLLSPLSGDSERADYMPTGFCGEEVAVAGDHVSLTAPCVVLQPSKPFLPSFSSGHVELSHSYPSYSVPSSSSCTSSSFPSSSPFFAETTGLILNNNIEEAHTSPCPVLSSGDVAAMWQGADTACDDSIHHSYLYSSSSPSASSPLHPMSFLSPAAGNPQVLLGADDHRSSSTSSSSLSRLLSAEETEAADPVFCGGLFGEQEQAAAQEEEEEADENAVPIVSQLQEAEEELLCCGGGAWESPLSSVSSSPESGSGSSVNGEDGDAPMNDYDGSNLLDDATFFPQEPHAHVRNPDIRRLSIMIPPNNNTSSLPSPLPALPKKQKKAASSLPKPSNKQQPAAAQQKKRKARSSKLDDEEYKDVPSASASFASSASSSSRGKRRKTAHQTRIPIHTRFGPSFVSSTYTRAERQHKIALWRQRKHDMLTKVWTTPFLARQRYAQQRPRIGGRFAPTKKEGSNNNNNGSGSDNNNGDSGVFLLPPVVAEVPMLLSFAVPELPSLP